jgi:glycosyltransferase involved in cell wall biosynthesis
MDMMAENPNMTTPARLDASSPCPKFSVVLPAFNEQENLPELHRRLTAVLEKMGSYELVFIDDGSSDQTWETIGDLAIDSHVVGLRFSRNFGHHVALTAGLDAARGEFVNDRHIQVSIQGHS